VAPAPDAAVLAEIAVTGSPPAPAATRPPSARPPVLRRLPGRRARFAASLAVLGPGIVSGFADNDAGGITTYSLAGAKFGYDLLWVILVTQVALFVTQEIGARIGLATGQGLTGLIRERFGVRWAAFAALTMIAANLGSTVSEFAGISAALSLFGVPVAVSSILAALAVITLISRGSFGRVQYFFVGIGLLVSAAYVISAVLARPDWARAATSLVIPHGTFNGAYMLAVVGTVGTTITPWGQGFIQAYVVDKRLRAEDLRAERVDVLLGVVITNVIAAFIVIATAATLWTAGQRDITSAADAAVALGPLAGGVASTLFAVGLLAASLLGLGVVPLASAYTACEAFGWEQGVDWRWREAPAFYGLLAFFVIFAALFLLIPGLPLIQVMFTAQVFNGLLLPIILVFVMLLAGDRRIMGDLASGRINLTLGWVVTALLVVMSITLVATSIVS
jgi:NRAMP (natural resistance-associated macrophage protein)-like metal ion transporter